MNRFVSHLNRRTVLLITSVVVFLSATYLVTSHTLSKQVNASLEEGVIYYLLTEDNEITIRYPQTMGGATSLGPRAFEVLMIEKVDRMNEIAEKYGAYWTHFTAVGPWFLAEQAERQSTKWDGVYGALIDQVRRGSASGHEYAPHPHAYWDPRVDLNTLVWDATKEAYVDTGADYFSWTEGFRELGSFVQLDSAAGYLYDYKKRLMEITRMDTVVERTGSWQFGNTPELQRVSIEALRMNGILANSDAHANLAKKGNAGSAYGSALYFTAEDSINKVASSAEHYGTLEFAPTPSPIILYDSNTLQQLNSKVDEGVKAFTDRNGRVKPGVHFIVGFTHAKNMMSGSNWQSTSGGDFYTLDRHLAYVSYRYAASEKPVIKFARASDAVKHYYDYYSKRPIAVRDDSETKLSELVFEYPVRILGGTDGDQLVSVKPPIWWDAEKEIAVVQILAGEKELGKYEAFTSPYPDLEFQTQGERSAVMRVTLAR